MSITYTELPLMPHVTDFNADPMTALSQIFREYPLPELQKMIGEMLWTSLTCENGMCINGKDREDTIYVCEYLSALCQAAHYLLEEQSLVDIVNKHKKK
jgi:hypothetical protein